MGNKPQNNELDNLYKKMNQLRGERNIVMENPYSEYSDGVVPMLNPKERTELIGKKISTLRKYLGLTQKEVSMYIEIPQQTYAGYESGKHEPPVEILVRLAFLYKTSVDNIVCMYDGLPDEYNPREDELIEEEKRREDRGNELDNIKQQIEELQRQINGLKSKE